MEDSKFKNLEDGCLIKLTHPEYGVWYFTSLTQIMKTFGLSTSTVYYTLQKNGQYNGWVADVVDGGDVLYKYINPKRI